MERGICIVVRSLLATESKQLSKAISNREVAISYTLGAPRYHV